MEKVNWSKKALAGFFVLFIFVYALRSDPLHQFDQVSRLLKQNGKEPKEERVTMGQLESQIAEGIYNQEDYIELSGHFAKALKLRGFYQEDRVFLSEDNYIISPGAKTSTDYEVAQMRALKEFLDAQGINLLYVSEPSKYTDDAVFTDDFGIQSYTNANADLFLSRIAEEGINYIDLREELKADGLDIKDLFYRTDHHWTTPAAFWGAGKIAEAMNQYCGYDIDPDIYNLDHYEQNTWEKCWLGEQGKKVAASYVGLDDFTEIKPAYDTSYTFRNEDGTTSEGTFMGFLNESVYTAKKSVYDSKSWHYSYQQRSAVNHNAKQGKVLILGDSYEQTTVPFLSLGIADLTPVIMRDFTGNLEQYILDNEFDTVLICYAQFMIGAHDSKTNANNRMFTFFEDIEV